MKIIIDTKTQRLHKKGGGKLITTNRNSTDNTNISRRKITIKQKWKKDNCMVISSDKQAKSHSKMDMGKKGKPKEN